DSFTDAESWTSRTGHPSALALSSATGVGTLVLVAGGFDGDQSEGQSHLYDPATDTWTAAGGLVTPRHAGFLGVAGGLPRYIGGIRARQVDVKYDANDFLGL